MKSIERFVLVVLALAIAVLFYFQFATSSSLAYVDSTKLLNGYEGMIVARKAYQQKALLWQANVDTLTNEVREEMAQYEKESATMSAKEKELAQELIRTKQQQLVDYQRAIKGQAQQEDQQMTTEVLTTVNAFITTYGKERGYDIVFAATDAGNIVYARESMDITEEVLNGLNKQYKGE